MVVTMNKKKDGDKIGRDDNDGDEKETMLK